MNLTTITYRQLVNTGNYENFAMEASATLAPDDEPEAAMRALTILVAGWAAKRAAELRGYGEDPWTDKPAGID